jgi:large subunit ribosomal protein L25
VFARRLRFEAQAMAEIVLNVEVRERTGTGGSRETRRAGLVPGVLYGGDKDPVAIAVKSNEFRKALYTGKLLGHLVTLKHGAETQPVIAKAVDMHPVTDEPVHFDLYRVDAHQQIKIEVTIHFANQDESPGLKRGGALNVNLHSLTVSCPADSIPEEIMIDLTGKDIGDSVRVSDVTLPANVEAAIEGDVVVASISAAKTEVAEEAAEGGETAEATEGGED